MTFKIPIRRFFFVLSAVLILGFKMNGATISFTPAGTQLDADAILDIGTFPTADISFAISIDTTGIAGSLVSLTMLVMHDPSELSFTGLQQSANHFTDNTFGQPNGPDGGLIQLEFSGGLVPPGTGVIHLADVSFTVLNGLDNNGVRDFWVTVSSANACVDQICDVPEDVTSSFDPNYQEVEVQPIPEPATLLTSLAGGLLLLVIRRAVRS
jgi:hypothetical protein